MLPVDERVVYDWRVLLEEKRASPRVDERVAAAAAVPGDTYTEGGEGKRRGAEEREETKE